MCAHVRPPLFAWLVRPIDPLTRSLFPSHPSAERLEISEDGSARATDRTTTSLVESERDPLLYALGTPHSISSSVILLIFPPPFSPFQLNLEVPVYSIDGEAEVITVG